MNLTENETIQARIRQIVRERAEAALEREQRIDNGPLAEALTDELLADPLTQDGLRTLLRGMTYRALTAWAAERRNRPAPDGTSVVETAGGVVTQALIDQQTRESRWARWVEHVGDRVVELSLMRKADLRIAAEERGKRIGTEWVRMQLLLALEQRLPDDRVTVGEHFSEDAIETLFGQTSKLAQAQLRAASEAMRRAPEASAARLAVDEARKKLLPGKAG